MTATGQNFEIYQGDTKTLKFTVYDSDNNDAILDISGATILWVAYKQTPENIVITKTNGSGLTITNAVSGLFEVYLLPVDTENLLGLYNHEAELTDSLSNVTTIAVGTMKVYKSKT